MLIFSYIKENKATNEFLIGYEWDIKGDIVVCFEFDTEVTKDVTLGMKFKELICRLLFEADHKKAYKDKNQEDLEAYCGYILLTSYNEI